MPSFRAFCLNEPSERFINLAKSACIAIKNLWADLDMAG